MHVINPDICNQNEFFNLSHASMIKVQYMSKWCNPLYWKVTNIQKWLKLIFIFCIPSWLAPKSLLALSQKYDNLFCSCCQCFTSNLLSYWLGYAISVHLCWRWRCCHVIRCVLFSPMLYSQKNFYILQLFFWVYFKGVKWPFYGVKG